MTAIDTGAGTLGFASTDDTNRARDVLAEAGYHEDGFRRVIGSASILQVRINELPKFRRMTAGGSPLQTLIRLFFLNIGQPLDAVAAALAPMDPAAWADAGFLRIDGDAVSPLLKLQPIEGLVLASDTPRELLKGSGGRVDYVMGVGQSSLLIVNQGVRRTVGQSLDLGAGCGLLGLVAAGHSERVFATDKNPRAVAMTRMNAALNGLTNVVAREGDMYDPVAGETFDLIHANPPYVISPGVRFIYRDSGLRGDEFCRTMLREAPARLNEGGLCQSVFNFAIHDEDDWQPALRRWFDGLGADVLVWYSDIQKAEDYALTWIQDTNPGADVDIQTLFDQWTGYYDREGIKAVGYGIVNVRKRSVASGGATGGGDNWVCIEDAPKRFQGLSGEAVLRRIELEDMLRPMDDAAMLDLTIRLSQHFRLEQTLAPSDEGLTAVKMTARTVDGPIMDANLDANVAGLIMRITGRRKLRDILAEMAADRGMTAEQLTPGGVTIARHLIERGFVEVEDAVK
jgi:SAM-dependent methyltransferase